MDKGVFSRRRFLGTGGATVLGALGLPALASIAGCQSVQQALGPKQTGGSAATIRYMGHFTALGDTARDLAQKQIDQKFRETVKAGTPRTPVSTSRPSESGAGTSTWREAQELVSPGSSTSTRTGLRGTTSARPTGVPTTGPAPSWSSLSNSWSIG